MIAAGFGSAQTHTHHTARNGSAKILYPYHPLFGMEFEVTGSAAGLRDVVLIKLPHNASRSAPAWMFDEAICAMVRSADKPVIDCAALVRLRRLLDSQGDGARTFGNELTMPATPALRDADSLVPSTPGPSTARQQPAARTSDSKREPGKVRASAARDASSGGRPGQCKKRRRCQ